MKRKKKYNRIKQVIVENESTGKALAAWLGYHPNSISQWSLNAAQPTIADLYRVAAYFNTNVHNLLVPTESLPGKSPCEDDKKSKPKKRQK